MAKINVPIICGYMFHQHIGHYDFKTASVGFAAQISVCCCFFSLEGCIYC